MKQGITLHLLKQFKKGKGVIRVKTIHGNTISGSVICIDEEDDLLTLHPKDNTDRHRYCGISDIDTIEKLPNK